MNTLKQTSIIIFCIFSFSVLSAQDVYSTIKEKTSNLFLEKLDITKDELQISFNNLPDNLEKYNKNTIEVYSQKHILKPGSQSVWARFRNGHKVVKKIPLNISVFVVKDVVVAGQRIKRNSSLSNSNLKLETKHLGKDWDQYFFTLKEINGSESKRLIKKGTVLTKRMVQAKQLVHSGNPVRVELKSGGLTITTNGIAKQNGAFGEQIKLKLDKTGKTIQGIVSSQNLVIVSQE
ncbi:MAG: flagella basal body P-ring formation protein FlgA [Calditrichaeota bacterium]|nr:MAG: flagella basal body P-ring formation protein FlgA [Calditrichota bacterium]MBL1204034.1 flagella basal body P-ring formation protein FlgA [Calditrichota bacterium]NOG43865.1 flagellar basal body P-ring formation protein FlgA [Calditrichota bacterium]